MISNDERREVAENLRYLADYPGAPVQYAEQFRNELSAVVLPDGFTHDYSELIQRLADLIEPIDQCPYYHRNQHECYCSVHEDMPVGSRDVLLALADKIERKSNDGTTNPDPMRPLATSLDLFGYARCIRKALGVQDDA